MKNLIILTCIFTLTFINLWSQDTFSIVAIDPETGEVGSAGASCVDLIAFNILDAGFLGELFPGVGAINTQASYTAVNQTRARSRMNAGDTPQEIIDVVVASDFNPTIRQYGIAAFVGGEPQTAGHTGENCITYANHILGPTYAIQGNILLGPEILENMEAMFLQTEGDLAHKLMAALQGANAVGADTRCEPNGTSSLFAFIKVAQPDDQFNAPSFSLSVRTRDGEGIEPIDSLQVNFDSYIAEQEQCASTYSIGPTIPGFRTKRCLSQVTYDGQIHDSEAFVVNNLIPRRKYNFTFCDGYNPQIFEARVVIKSYDSDTETIGETLSDEMGCLHEIRLSETPQYDDVIIIITDNGDCQETSKNLENGIPSFKCGIGR